MQSTRDLGRLQPNPCPEQTQPWGQTRCLRAFNPIWADSTPGMEMAQPLLAPPAWAVFMGKNFPSHLTEHLILQSVAIAFHSPALCCSEEQLLNSFLTDTVRKAQ